VSNPVKNYEIGGINFEQRRLVLGQWRQLRAELEGLELPPGDFLRSLVTALEQAGRLDRALAIVLTPRGTSPKDKDVGALAEQLEYAITPEQIAEVLADFFTCNPVSSILSQLAGVVHQVLLALQQELLRGRTASSRPSSSSPGEISPSESGSSGESPPPKPSPGCGTEVGT